MDENEKFDIAKWFSIVALLSGLLGFVFNSIWIDGAWRYVHAPFEEVNAIDPVVGTEFILMVALGGFLTLVVVMFNDKHKQVQTTLLGLGLVVVLGVLLALGIGQFILQPTLHVGLGFALGIALAALAVLRIEDLSDFDFDKSDFGDARTKSGGNIRLKKTTKFFKWSIYAVVIGANFVSLYIGSQNQFEEPALTAFGVVVSVAFIYAIEELVDIDVKQDEVGEASFELIGPKQSGKTYSTLALYLSVLNNDNYDLVDNSPTLDDLIEKIPVLNHDNPDVVEDEEVSFDSISGTALPNNKEYNIEFLIKSGRTRKAKINTMDYRGELMPDIAESYVNVMPDGGRSEQEDDSEDVDLDGHEISTESDTDQETTTESDADTESVDEDSAGNGTSDLDVATDDDDSINKVEPAEVDTDSGISDETYDSLAEETEETAQDIGEVDADEEEYEPSPSSDPTTAATQHVERDETEESPENPTDAGADDETPTQASGFDQSADSEDDEEDTDTDQDERDRVISEVTENLKNSNKIVMLLDVERFIGKMKDREVGMQIGSMKKIGRKRDSDDVILVATKSDYLIEEWRDKKNYQGDPKVEDPKAWKSFREVVSQKFYNTASTKGLMQTANVSEVYPVYYYTGDDDDLTVNEQGNIETEGYDELLESLVR